MRRQHFYCQLYSHKRGNSWIGWIVPENEVTRGNAEVKKKRANPTPETRQGKQSTKIVISYLDRLRQCV